MTRIGIFGGTFNPVHIGHLRVCEEIREEFSLNRIFMIPASVPPHKSLSDVASAEDRLEMLNLSSPGPGIEISDVEMNREGPSYSVDTINEIKRSVAEESETFLIVGLDAFLEIHLWKCFREIISSTPVIVMNRPSGNSLEKAFFIEAIHKYLNDKLDSGYFYSESENCFGHDSLKQIFPAMVTPLDISSTNIRERITAGKTIKYLVPEKVEEYIKQRGLY